MSKLIIDESRWPLVTMKVQAGYTDADIEAIVAFSLKMAEKKECYAVAMDLLECGLPTAAQRNRLAQMVEMSRDAMRRYYVGSALAITSAPLRTTLNMLSLVVKPPFPMRMVSTLDEGVQWCKEQLRRATEQRRAVG